MVMACDKPGQGGTILNYAKKNLTDDDLEKLTVEDDTEYDVVDFSQNKLSTFGLEKVLDICRRCEKFRVLKLFKNDIDDEGAEALAKFIHDRPTIEEMHLSHNRFTVKGITAIVAAGDESRPPRANPLWLRLEQNDVAEPRKLADDLSARYSVCDRREPVGCNVRQCIRKCRVHVPHLYFQRGCNQEGTNDKYRNRDSRGERGSHERIRRRSPSYNDRTKSRSRLQLRFPRCDERGARDRVRVRKRCATGGCRTDRRRTSRSRSRGARQYLRSRSNQSRRSQSRRRTRSRNIYCRERPSHRQSHSRRTTLEPPRQQNRIRSRSLSRGRNVSPVLRRNRSPRGNADWLARDGEFRRVAQPEFHRQGNRVATTKKGDRSISPNRAAAGKRTQKLLARVASIAAGVKAKEKRSNDSRLGRKERNPNAEFRSKGGDNRRFPRERSEHTPGLVSEADRVMRSTGRLGCNQNFAGALSSRSARPLSPTGRNPEESDASYTYTEVEVDPEDARREGIKVFIRPVYKTADGQTKGAA